MTFDIEYQGHSAEVVALVSSSISNEVLLSWHTLKEIGVIPIGFPNIGMKAAAKTILPVVWDVLGTLNAVNQMIEEFNSVFDNEGHLRAMKGEPMTIHMKEDIPIIPLHICNPRKTPYAYQTAAKDKLDDDERNGMIEKVGGPSKWCSAMSFVPKPGGKVRSVLDLVHLNRYVRRPTHPFPAPKDIVALIPNTATCFAVFDAKNRYWQIPLDEESKPLTTVDVINTCGHQWD